MAGLVEGFGRIQVFAQYVPDGQGVVVDLIPKVCVVHLSGVHPSGVLPNGHYLVEIIHECGVFHGAKEGDDLLDLLGGLHFSQHGRVADGRRLRTSSLPFLRDVSTH